MACLDQMLEEDEPSVVGEPEAMDDDNVILVWFSEEEFAQGPDLDEW